jgi:hypothetical protein
MSGNNTEFDDNNGDLRDPALRRTLDHAPDSDARPDPRTRDAILKMAHNLAPAPVTTSPAANSASAAPWWRRLFGGGGEPRARMPWNAAFATVLVAGFVAVLWHREPVPDARLDGEARVGGATAPAQPPVPAPVQVPAQPSAEAAPPAEAPAAAVAPPPAVAQAPVAPAAPAAERRAKVPRDSSSAKEAADAASADAAVQRAAPQPSRKQAAPVPAEPVAPAAPPAIVAEQSTPAPAMRDERREERVESERRGAYAAGAPAAAAPPPPAVAAAPSAALRFREPQQDTASALGAQDNANAEVSGGLHSTAPGAAAKAITRPRSAAASFSALERWTSFTLTRSGASVRHERGDVEGLPALVSTVARSATTPDEPLAAPVEARLELYRGNALLAVLEIADGQVRWTSQPGGAALVGTPPAQALDALRSLLTR